MSEVSKMSPTCGPAEALPPAWPVSIESTGHIVDHYHKTLDLTARIWVQRDRSFLLLVIVVGVAALLTFSPALATWLLELLGRAATNGADPNINKINSDFPSAIVNALLLLAVFFLTMKLYQNTVALIRYYKYVGLLETEIRQRLGIQEPSLTFARESLFYWRERPRMFWIVRYSYVLILAGLLTFLYGLRFMRDVGPLLSGGGKDPDLVSLVADVAIGLPTLLVFLAYVSYSFVKDRPESKP